MKSKIIIRADGGSSIGMGHVVRCLALADMLKNDFEISVAIQQPSETVIKIIASVTKSIIVLPETNDFEKDSIHFSAHLKGDEIVLLDGYNFKTEYQQKIKHIGCKLAAIDDLHQWHTVADVLINHAESIEKKDYSSEDYTQFCLGLNYILLRKDFFEIQKKNKNSNAPFKIFISMGAADEHNNTLKFTEALLEINSIAEINLMLSSINPHLKNIESFSKNKDKIKLHFNLSAMQLVNLLQNCDISICPASSIALESCAVGIVLISGVTANNQQGNLQGLKKHDVIFDLGNFNLLTKTEIKNKIETIILQKEKMAQTLSNQEKMIDGKSPERLLTVFKKLTTDE